MKNEITDIQYKENTAIDVKQLTSLYSSVGWTGYTDHPDKMNKILKGSLCYLSAWDGSDLVGLIRAVGDDASILFIQDILVHPDYQREKIGSTLINKLLKKYSHIRQTVLLTDNTDKTNAFYSSIGFESAKDTETVAFIRMNWEK